MVRLRVLEILEKQGKTKYWLFGQMNMPNYSHVKKIIENRTSSIRFETLIKFSQMLEVPVGELFIQTKHSENPPEK